MQQLKWFITYSQASTADNRNICVFIYIYIVSAMWQSNNKETERHSLQGLHPALVYIAVIILWVQNMEWLTLPQKHKNKNLCQEGNTELRILFFTDNIQKVTMKINYTDEQTRTVVTNNALHFSPSLPPFFFSCPVKMKGAEKRFVSNGGRRLPWFYKHLYHTAFLCMCVYVCVCMSSIHRSKLQAWKLISRGWKQVVLRGNTMRKRKKDGASSGKWN